MAIRSSTSTRITSATTAVTGARPAGSVAGDRLLVWLVIDGNTFIAPPAGEGWAVIATASTASPADINNAFLYEKKVSDGAETFAFVANTPKYAIIQVVALTGRHASDAAVVGTPTITNTSAASPLSVAVSGVTAVAADDVLWFGQIDQVGRIETWSFGAISGYTQLQNDANNNYITSGCFAKENVSAGATGTLTSTATRLTGSSNGSWSGVVVSIPTGVVVPTISIGDLTVDRADGTASVPVTLSGPAPVGGVTVNYAMQDDTATAPSYYTAASGTLTFAEGESTKNVTVSIVP